MANEKRLTEYDIEHGKWRACIDNHLWITETGGSPNWLMGDIVDKLAMYEHCDFQPVVRCKDCKHRFTRNNCQGRGMDYFCASGERRKNV